MAILLMVGMLPGMAASEPLDRREEFICGVTDLSGAGADFQENPLFVQRDTLGYLWFFGDLSAYRYNGLNYKSFSYQDLFGTDSFGKWGILRGVLRLPGGYIGCHFGSSRSGRFVSDTLCAFNPVSLRPVESGQLPKKNINECLFEFSIQQGEGMWEHWILNDTVHGTWRVAKPVGAGDSLKTIYRAPDGWSIRPLFSAPETGDFFLLQPMEPTVEFGPIGTVHCALGECVTSWDDFAYTRAVDPLRKHQNQNMWFDSDGSFLTVVYRHESHPPYDREPFWVHKRDGALFSDDINWSSFLDLKQGFRGSEVRYHAGSQLIWVLNSNQLRVFNRSGEMLANEILPVSEEFTLGLHDLYFLNAHEAIFLSVFGILHVSLRQNPFDYQTLEDSQKGFNLGCRSMVSWNRDTILLRTDASGIYGFLNGPIRLLFPDAKGCGGMLVDDQMLTFTSDDLLLQMRDWDSASIDTLAKFGSRTTTWRLNRGKEGTLYVLRRGLGVWRSGQGLEAFEKGWNDAYEALEWRSKVLVPGSAGLFCYDDVTSKWGPASDLYPALSTIRTACHAILEDSNGKIWISTKGQGLGCWDPSTESPIQWLGTEEGMPSNTIYGALEDDKGRIWASTNAGLIRFNPMDGNLQVFGIRSGLSETEFNRTSYLKHLDGTMHFGAIAGVISFDPASIGDQSSAMTSRLVVDRILQHNRESRGIIEVTSDYRQFDRVQLGPHDDFLSVRPVVLDYAGIHWDFAYRLLPRGEEVSEESWLPLEDTQIHLSNIPSGEWVLEIKAKSAECGWLASRLFLPIDVRIPFYMKGAYQLLGALLVFGLIFSIYSIHNRNLRKRNDRLEMKIAERTKVLNEMIVLKDNYLAETHHRVKNNLQIVSSLLDLQASQLSDERVRGLFNVSKTRIDSIHLIHQRLYNRPDAHAIDFKSYLIELVRLVERSQVGQMNILDLEILGDDLEIRHRDGVPLGMICNELVTNTIKHVVPHQPSTNVRIDLALLEDDEVCFTYDDAGPGLPIGQDFEEMDSLGLRLVGRFVHQLQGTVEVDVTRPSRVRIRFRQMG